MHSFIQHILGTSHTHTHLPIPNPTPYGIDFISDHMSFKTFSDHNRMIILHISMLFTVHRTLSIISFNVRRVKGLLSLFCKRMQLKLRAKLLPKVTQLCQ